MNSQSSAKLIECSGTPREMGRQYGEQAREAILENIEVFTGASWHPESARTFSPIARRLLRERLPDVLDELDGVAEGSGADSDRVLLMNHMNTFGCEMQECTPMALRNSDAGPLVAKNNDGAGDRYHYVVRRSAPARGIPMLQVTYAGWLSGMDALNAEGLANTHASVGSKFDKSGPRIDIRLWTYHLMRHCADTHAFLDGLVSGALTGKGFNVIVGDRAGRCGVVEAAVPLIARRGREGAFLYATNHYVTPPLCHADARTPQGRKISERRLAYLSWVEQTRPPQTLADVQALLSSHESWAPCRHGGATVSHTEWSMIALPREGALLLAAGPPCATPYERIAF